MRRKKQSTSVIFVFTTSTIILYMFSRLNERVWKTNTERETNTLMFSSIYKVKAKMVRPMCVFTITIADHIVMCGRPHRVVYKLFPSTTSEASFSVSRLFFFFLSLRSAVSSSLFLSPPPFSGQWHPQCAPSHSLFPRRTACYLV